MRLLPLGFCVFLLASVSAMTGASANPCSYHPQYPSEPCVDDEPYDAPEPHYDRERYNRPCPFCGPPRPFYWQRNECRGDCDWYRPRRKTYHWPRPCDHCEEEQGYPEPEPCGGDCGDRHAAPSYPRHGARYHRY